MRQVTRIAREEGQSRVEFWLSESSRGFEQALRMGFRREGSPFNLAVVFYRKDIDRQFLLDHWYYTLGDMDIL